MRHFLSAFFLSVFALNLYAADPEGFTDPKLMAKVMKGEIVIQRPIENDMESKAIVKSYFKKVTEQAYLDLMIDYSGYPDLFEEVVDGKLVKANPEKTELDYWLHTAVKIGIIKKHAYPEGHHSIKKGALPTDETLITNSVTNYKEYMSAATQKIRVIPYQDGLLVEDTVHIKAASKTLVSKAVKKQVVDFFTSYTDAFRAALKGD